MAAIDLTPSEVDTQSALARTIPRPASAATDRDGVTWTITVSGAGILVSVDVGQRAPGARDVVEFRALDALPPGERAALRTILRRCYLHALDELGAEVTP